MSSDISTGFPREAGRVVTGADRIQEVRLKLDKEQEGAQTGQAAEEPPAARQNSGVLSAEDLRKAAEDLNREVQDVSRVLQFSVDEDSGLSVITVSDSQTGKLIRQIPPEEVMALRQHLDELRDAQHSVGDGAGLAAGVFVRAEV